MSQMFIPGMRVEIRDAECHNQRIDRSSDGGNLLHHVSLSELARWRSTRFTPLLDANFFVDLTLEQQRNCALHGEGCGVGDCSQ